MTQRLIKFAGTIPISYRGTTYHIPVTVWIPPAYPFQGPNLFVSPTADMAIKQAHQHVDLEGRCYLPSLSQWNPANQNGLVQALTELQGVCAVNPPVYAKPKDAPIYKGPANPYASTSQQQPSGTQPYGGGGGPGGWGNANSAGSFSSGQPVGYGGGNAALAAAEAQQIRDLKNKATELITAQCKTIATEMNQFMAMQNKLVEGEREIAEQMHRMDLHAQQIDAALKWTQNATQECDAWIASHKPLQLSDINVDDIVVPVNGLSGQLLESLAARLGRVCSTFSSLHFLNLPPTHTHTAMLLKMPFMSSIRV